ncbi:hypothetical protein [Hymenobacter cavernae]|uniref:STAS/SEC14 domain-containing protein n=1 Tax=Hymenobacter cavernae TaxID=2044852 RepID=A0ABQ1UWH4_9BACT|nr:hypothetical protein [Hymenobacter cavernae]GGF26799.1 hypothetical protein GCM10011383_42940 [Hymenobacter cavernae]
MRFQWLDNTYTLLRPALKYGRDLVAHYRPALALVDLNGLPDLSIEDQLWMTVNWLPIIARQKLQRVALVLPATVHNQMAVEAVLWAGRHLVCFEVQFFTDTSAALDWTTESAPQIPTLEAEWHLATTQLLTPTLAANLPLSKLL